MKILILGSNGLLGQKLVQLLQNTPDISFLATARGANRLQLSQHFEYQSVDITQADAINAVINDYKPHCIINAAAMTQVDDCEHLRHECWQLNVAAVGHIVQACARYNVHLVHVSTDFIFDGNKGALYTETDVANPLSFYGRSKLAAESLLTNSTISYSILRTVLVYGVAQDMSRSNIVLWVKKSLEQNININVVNDQLRTPTLAEDLAIGCLLAAQHRAKGIFNISGNEPMMIHEMAMKIADFFGLDAALMQYVSSDTLRQPAARPPRTGFDITKARTQLGYEPRTFVQGLETIKKQIEF